MTEKEKRQECSVRYEPIKQDGFFDIKAPENPIQEEFQGEPKKEMGTFLLMGLSVVMVLTLGVVVANGNTLFKANQSIAHAGFEGLTQAAEAAQSRNFEEASSLFRQSELAFDEVSKNVRYLTHQANGYLNKNLYLDAANKLIESSVSVSKLGQDLIQIAESAEEIPALFNSPELLGAIKEKQAQLEGVLAETLQVQRNLTTLGSEVLPADLQKQISTAQLYVGEFLAALRSLDQHFETALVLLGDEVPHRYLVLLQNNHELRATGGFIGSYLLVDVNDGAITKMETNDVYRTDSRLTQVIEPPAGIDQVADRWYFRDANYSPDFPTAAKKLMWFLDQSKGPSVDTVIAIDQTVAESFLRLTGPIASPDLPVEISAENFNDFFSFYTESKLSGAFAPKTLLFKFIPHFKERVLSLNQFQPILSTVSDLVAARHIQVYSNQASVQQLAEALKVSGKMIEPSEGVDYLAVVSTSIGGNKSDAFIRSKLSHTTEVNRAGEVIDHLTIEKAHVWKESDFAQWKAFIQKFGNGKHHEKTLRFIQGEGENMDYMRVYVPKGSSLVSIDGLDISKIDASTDLGYTVFGFPFGPVAAGSQKTVRLSYKLPETLAINSGAMYRFIAQKQAGLENTQLSKKIITAEGVEVVKSYPVSAAFDLSPEYEAAFDQNQFFLTALAPAF